jgi:hypothetical protein
MMTIDALSLATVVGGKAAATSTSTTSSTTATKPDAGQLAGDAASGCFSGLGKAITGKGVNAGSLAASCAIGAGQSVLTGLGSLFGLSTGSSTTGSKSK